MKLRFYLDLKTKRFLERMSFKEQLLTDMIRNITRELKLRGKGELLKSNIGFEQIYGKSSQILKEYNQEISAIKEIIVELDRLELVIQRKDDLKLLREVELIKDLLTKALDDHKLGKIKLSNQEIAKMVHDYSREIKSLLRIYDDIDGFQKRAAYMGDSEVVGHIENQKDKIVKIFEESRIASGAPDKVVEDYIKEAATIVDVLKQIDQLQQKAGIDSSLYMNADSAREKIVTKIDSRILNLLGYTSGEKMTGRTITEYFNSWKVKKISEYQISYTRYRILRDNLIKTATTEQRDQMLEAEVSDALLSYANNKFELAEIQFNQVLSGYQTYYPSLDGVKFYRSEANYANNYYDAAEQGYVEVLQNHPQSKFLGLCHLRLMAINYTYYRDDRFFNHYEKLLEFVDDIEAEDMNKAHYLAGVVLIRKRQLDEANEALKKISENSQYYLVAQYLRGVALVNLDKFDLAANIFKQIIEKDRNPWTDINISVLRNESLLKMGYLHYQRGEHDQALEYFNQVSKGFDGYDESLIGQAWSNLKKSQYGAAINKVDLICNNFLMSNYTYEALVLSAHCKRAQDRTNAALKDLRYVASARQVLNRVNEYNTERSKVLKQLDQLEILEEKVLEHQNKSLYPKILRARNLINQALASFRFRGAVSSRVMEEYNSERKLILRQVEEFDRIIAYAEEQGEEKMLKDALMQRERMIGVLQKYQLKQPLSNVSYFMDYPLATKEGGIIYRRGILQKLVSELVLEKQIIQKDLQIISELASLNVDSKIDITIDLEILEEDLNDLNNQLNRFEIWLSRHQVENIETQTVRWANFSGFGISDINFSLFREKNQQMVGLAKNLATIESILVQKKNNLETRLARFDNEVRKIQKEMESEKVRLEKLEKEKYFQEIYFENKTREIERESTDGMESFESLFNQGSGKK